MSQTIYEILESMHIGRVEFVSPDEIKILLDVEAPDSVALNAGSPRPFPRVHGYVLIPNDDGYLVGQIEWITVERSAFPKRKGVQDFGVVDLPFPLRRMSLNPLGTLRVMEFQSSLHGQSYDKIAQPSQPPVRYEFRRGAEMLPTIGDPVLLPSELQLKSIVQSGEQTRVRIGTSPLASDADVYVDPDRLFGRHLAILGNTGSGKSCSVAGLIHWSLEAAASHRPASNANLKMPEGTDSPQRNSVATNARFIILDPNGEYARAFSSDKSLSKARIFRVSPDITKGEKPLRVPVWFWNSAEWCAIAQASSRTQRPALIQALRQVRDGMLDSTGDREHQMRRFLRTVVTTLHLEKNSGSPWGSFPKPKNFYLKIKKWKSGIDPELHWFSGEPEQKLERFVEYIEELCIPRSEQHPDYDFTRQEIDELIFRASAAHSTFGGTTDNLEPPDVDAPRPFTGEDLLRSLESTMEMLNISDNVETLLIRIRALLSDSRLKPVIDGPLDLTLEQWLKDYLGTDKDGEANVTVVDLSLVPSDVVSIITSVIARLIFESLQRYVKAHPEKKSLPTVLVMEEAHTFVKRYRDDMENPDTAAVCCQVFERIAREGRKFGLGLVLSSQRPSELSPTVLSQCNTFLLHRISNDRDQELVQRLVPGNLRGLLRDIPSLPSQTAILLGWASELPVLVRMRDVAKPLQPRSDDPDYWDVWTGGNDRPRNWEAIATEWQQANLDEELEDQDEDPFDDTSNGWPDDDLLL